jgi:hypothetical protein
VGRAAAASEGAGDARVADDHDAARAVGEGEDDRLSCGRGAVGRLVRRAAVGSLRRAQDRAGAVERLADDVHDGGDAGEDRMRFLPVSGNVDRQDAVRLSVAAPAENRVVVESDSERAGQRARRTPEGRPVGNEKQAPALCHPGVDRGDLRVGKRRRSFGRAFGRLRVGDDEHPRFREALRRECFDAGRDGIAVLPEEPADRPEVRLERNDVAVLRRRRRGALPRSERRLPDRHVERVVHGQLGRRRRLSLLGGLRADRSGEDEDGEKEDGAEIPGDHLFSSDDTPMELKIVD